MLNTEWTELEIIDLINEGSGLGFGIIGNKSTGVVVRTILASGAADRDQRLRAGDHIFHIGDVNVRGMTSDQVAGVLRQAGEHVRLLIGRPIRNPETESVPPGMGHYTQTVATYELDGHLQAIAAAVFNTNDLAEASHFLLSSSLGLNYSIHEDSSEVDYIPYSSGFVEVGELHMPLDLVEKSTEILQNSLNDAEFFDVILIKGETGLGITIAGYIGESSESHLNGIFVKSIIKGSAADFDGRIHVNDQIIEVNDQSLDGYTNHCAVDVLKEAGCRVHLKLARYHRGPIYEQLQACTAHTPPPLRSSIAAPKNTSIVLSKSMNAFNFDGGELSPDVELSIIAQWKQILGDDYDIIVAQISKFKDRGGLGISLEGTVDVDNGIEVRPRHYIRSILPEGPVGINGRLKKLDELLEVNGKRLYGLNHVEVVHCLKELPQHVRLVVARRLDGILHSTMPCCSELSLFSGEEDSLGPDSVDSSALSANRRLQNYKSRSLEPLYGGGLALWSAEPLVIQLEKQDRGLGFSILDYQDPQQSDRTVIVIRSLVPNGVAHCDRRLVPGDRLVFVNDIDLERADLQQAVLALKSAPRGPVTLGVCKPLSSNLFHKQQASSNDNTRSTPQLCNNYTLITAAATATSSSSTKAKEEPLCEVAFELEMDLEHEDVEEPSRLQMPDLVPPLLIDLPNEMATSFSLFKNNNNNGYCAEAEPFANQMNSGDTPPATIIVDDEVHQSHFCINSSMTAETSSELAQLVNELEISSTSHEVLYNNNVEDRFDNECLKSDESSENVSSSLLDESFSSEPSCPPHDFSRPSTPQFDRGFVIQLDGDPFDDVRPASMDLSSSISGCFLLEALMDKCEVEEKEATLRLVAVELVADVVNSAINALRIDVESDSDSLSKSKSEDESHLVLSVEKLIDDVLQLALEIAERKQHCPSIHIASESVSTDDDADEVASIRMQLVEQLVDEVLDEAVEFLQPHLAVRFQLPCSSCDVDLQLSSSFISSSGSENSSVMSTSSLDCLEELEVIRDTGSDTDALLNYYKDVDEDENDDDDNVDYLLDFENGNAPAATFNHKSSTLDSQDDLVVEQLPETNPMTSTIPSTLERSIHVIKHSNEIGFHAELLHKNFNGCRIKKIMPGTTLDMDGRLQVGDYITSMNNETLRHVSEVVARDVIRRAMLSGLPIRVNYLSAADVLSKQTAETFDLCQTSGEILAEFKTAESESLPNSSLSSQSLHLGISHSPSNCEDEVTSVDAEILPPAPSLKEDKDVDDDAATDCVTELPKSLNIRRRQKNLLTDGSPAISDSSWGPAQHVTLHREVGQSLGISIVGGRVAGHSTDDSISGIFIKHVSEGSPAEREACLRTGDRILEVNGIDLRDATHDRAVEVIRGSGTTVHFTIQSLTDSACPTDNEDGSLKHKGTTEPVPFQHLGTNNESSSVVPCRKDNGSVKKTKIFQVEKDSMNMKENVCPPREASHDGDDLEDDLEDEFGYSASLKSLRLKYADAKGELLLLDIRKCSQPGLGLQLAGNKNHGVMAVYVCGIKPNGAAEIDGRLRIGDELLEINGQVLHGRSHVNAAPLINGCRTSIVKLIVLRTEDNIEQMAVKPISHSQPLPTSLVAVNSNDTIQSLVANGITPNCNLHKYSTCGERIYRITLRKSKQGLGFAIMDGGFNDEVGIYVKSVSENGPAAEEGTLTKGDRLCEINGKDYTTAMYDEALDALRSVKDVVELVVARGDLASLENGEFHPPATPPPPAAPDLESEKAKSISTSCTSSSPSLATRSAVAVCDMEQTKLESRLLPATSLSSSPLKESPTTLSDDAIDPQTCPILPGKNTLIEFLKGDSGLGLSIVGGCDTLLGAIIIHEVYKDGAAFKDGRLWAGDHVLEVNDSCLREVTHDHAIKVLRSTGAKVKILVYRDENPLTEEDLYDLETIELTKKPNKGLGISIVGRKNNEGVFVSAIVKGGAAESDGRLQPGDQIISINGEDMKKASQTEVATTLKSMLGKTTLVVARLKSGTNNHDDFSFNLAATGSNCTKKSSKVQSNASKTVDEWPAVATACRRVELLHDASGSLGFSLVGGNGSTLGNVPCIVIDIIPNGSADRCGNLQIGDQILSLNGEDLRHKTLQEVLQALRSAVRSNVVLDVFEAPALLVKAALKRERGSLLKPPQFKEIVLKFNGVHGLGFTIVGGVGLPPPYEDMPIYVKNVLENGAAAMDGRLRRGDQIVAVNDQSFENVTCEQAVSILKRLKDTTIRLQVMS